MKKFVAISCLLLIVSAAQGAGAMDWSPIQISLLPSIQLVPEEKDIYGLKLNLPFGSNRNTYGIDIGFGSSGVNMHGLQVNILTNMFSFSDAHDFSKMKGIQIAGLFNMFTGSDMEGVQFGGIFNMSDVKGLQISGLFNSGSVHGLQFGLYNHARKARGLQLGVVNIADDMKGIQIGLINFIKNSPVPFLPIVNLKF